MRGNIYQEALAGEERTFDHSSIPILEVARRLGEVWKAQGRSQEAQDLLKQVRVRLVA
jgi:hypothetical protein